MNKGTTISFIFFCIIGLACSQVVTTTSTLVLSEQDLANTELMKVLNNYFGCKTWSDGVCVECSARYYFNNEGICCEVKPQCRVFNVEVGICESCYQGYSIVDGNCTLSNQTQNVDLGCRTWVNGVCTGCSARWYFGAGNVCQPVSDSCRTWSSSTGNCESCYNGYQLQNGACVRINEPEGPVSDLLCAVWVSGVCQRCSERAYFRNGICTQVNNNCQTWDNLDGRCLTCYQGYNLAQSGLCVLVEEVAPTDPGCKIWDRQNNRCTECAPRWIFNNGACIAVNNLCKTNDNSGQCLTCYVGYEVRNGQCVLCDCDKPQDLGCKTWDWFNQICFECSQNWFYREGTGCVPVNDQCRTSNQNGECTACYNGYQLTNGACHLSGVTGPSDLGCRNWDWNTQRCLECSTRWTFNQQGICVAVNDLCATFNSNGVCLTCYKGFTLTNGVCSLSQTEITGPTDLGCKTWNWDTQRCLECSLRWTFNQQGSCVPVSDLCSTYSNGICTACYKGYTLNNGVCSLSQTEITGPTDLGCRTWNWDNQTCLECSARWVFNSNRVCVPVNDNCATYNTVGVCTACFKGFTLNNGVCQVSQVEITGPTDPGCKTWDWDNQRCLECSTRWIFNNGVCRSVENLCKDFDANTGACTSCYEGYEVRNGQCVLCNCDKPQDLGCKTWDWQKQICFECSQNWFFQEGTGCVPVNDQCRTSSVDGQCTACYKGYSLTNGACHLDQATGPSDLGCKRWDWENQVCLECSARWTFNSNRTCVAVNDNCATFGTNGACLTCYKGYTLNNGVCSISQVEVTGPTDLGCRRWDWDNQVCLECSTRWVFNANRVCIPVNDNCATFNTAGVCSACYRGYTLNNGVCSLSQTEVTGPTDLGCRTWDWNNQICLECSVRFIFNANKVCVPVNDFCASYNNNGVCLTCYKGYSLNNGVCSLSQTEITGPTDLGCRRWNWDNQVCLECSARWVLRNGVCVAVNDFCATFNANGACLTCYKGYTLNNGVCSISQVEVTGPTDLGCRRWDWDNQVCLECSVRWSFNSNRICVPVNDLCATFGNNGACLTCYKGYTLNNGVCSISQVEVTGPTDLGCRRWDWDNQVCLECSVRYVFSANRTCIKVNDNCASFNSDSGVCTACYTGYSLNNGVCEVHNVLCKTTSQNGTCATCYNGYVLYQNQCVAISSLASLAQYYAACCPEKLAELQKENRLN